MLSMNDMASRTFFYQAIRPCTRSLYDQPWCCFRSSKFMKIKRRDCDRILFEKATQGASKLHFITFFNQRTRFSKGRKETSHSTEICLDKKGLRLKGYQGPGIFRYPQVCRLNVFRGNPGKEYYSVPTFPKESRLELMS